METMTDLNQAAERLRRLASQLEQTFGVQYCTMTMRDDINELEANAKAYLAEHAADDGELITREWWQSLSCVETCCIWLDDDTWLDWGSEAGVYLCTESSTIDLPHITTRGQLRMLLRALNPERGES